MSEQNLVARYAAAVQKGREIAHKAGAGYEETPAWRVNELTVEGRWKEARAAGHTMAELMEATAVKGDG